MDAGSYEEPTCLQPTGKTFIDLLGKTHVLELLHRLLNHETPHRFNELKRVLGITATTLSRRLDALVEHGLVHREVFAEVPARVEYGLTERGETLRPVLESLFCWVDEHMA